MVGRKTNSGIRSVYLASIDWEFVLLCNTAGVTPSDKFIGYFVLPLLDFILVFEVIIASQFNGSEGVRIRNTWFLFTGHSKEFKGHAIIDCTIHFIYNDLHRLCLHGPYFKTLSFLSVPNAEALFTSVTELQHQFFISHTTVGSA